MTVSERPVNQLIKVQVRDALPATRRNLMPSTSGYVNWPATGPCTTGGSSFSTDPGWWNGGVRIEPTGAGAFVWKVGGVVQIRERGVMTFSVIGRKHLGTWALSVTPRIRWSTGAVTNGVATPLTLANANKPNDVVLAVTATPPLDATTGQLELFGTFEAAGRGFGGYAAMAEYGSSRGEFFNGDKPDTAMVTYGWEGERLSTPSYESVEWIDLNCKVTGFNATRGGRADGAANSIQVSTSTLTLVGDIDLGVTTYLRPNCEIRLIGPAGIFYTATMIDAAQKVEYDKPRNRRTVHTTITAADAAQAAGNTIRHGVSTPSGVETWEERITRLNASAATFKTSPPLGNQKLFWAPTGDQTDQWAKASNLNYTTERNFGQLAVRVPFEWAVRTFPAGSLGVRRTLTNLVPGKSYGFTAYVSGNALVGADENHWYRASIVGGAFGNEVLGDWAGNPLPMVVFTATSTTHTFQIANSRDIVFGQNVGYLARFWDIRVYEVGIVDDYLLQDVAYESNLSNHYDLACDSVGARWWVDRNNVVQFRRSPEATGIVAEFTDDRKAGALEYTDIDTSFDTRNVVNTLTLRQHGAKLNEEGQPVTDDYSALVVEPFSAEAWGRREASLDTCLWLGFEHELDLETRAAEIFTDRGNPSYRVRHIRWNAQEDPELASTLDIYDRVKVLYRGEIHVGRIISLKHAVSQTRWMMDIFLTDVTTGPTFAELSAYYAGKTWAQMSALTAGQTFAEFSKRPLKEV